MSAAADRARRARRLAAAPGGSHDRLVRLAAVGLPALVGMIAAVMIVLPMFPQSEISFLLDRNKVAVVENRLAVHAAAYRGLDDHGRPFSVAAGDVVQHSAAAQAVSMAMLTAHMQLADGTAQALAPSGIYHPDTSQMLAAGPVRMTTSTGYRVTTSAVTIDLKTRRAIGAGGVTGATPRGVFSADRLVADLGARTLTLDGHARLRMVPGAHSPLP